MGWISIFALACALAMDAFAVAIVSGIVLVPLTKRHVFRLAFHFGLFQALMPLIGWSAGKAVHRYISEFDHWVAFGLLTLIGGKMLWEAIEKDKANPVTNDPTSGWTLVILSLATSIDALSVGLSMAMVGSPILIPAIVIGLAAAAFTCIGMILGFRIGALWGKRVEAIGGLILLAIGVKILIEHM